MTELDLLAEVEKLKQRLLVEKGRSALHSMHEVRDGLLRVLNSKADIRDKMQSVVSFGTLALTAYYEFIWDTPLVPQQVINQLFRTSSRYRSDDARVEDFKTMLMETPFSYKLHYVIAKAIAYLRK